MSMLEKGSWVWEVLLLKNNQGLFSEMITDVRISLEVITHLFYFLFYSCYATRMKVLVLTIMCSITHAVQRTCVYDIVRPHTDYLTICLTVTHSRSPILTVKLSAVPPPPHSPVRFWNFLRYCWYAWCFMSSPVLTSFPKCCYWMSCICLLGRWASGFLFSWTNQCGGNFLFLIEAFVFRILKQSALPQQCSQYGELSLSWSFLRESSL